MFDKFFDVFEEFLHFFAKTTVHSLEIVGIGIVIFGCFKVLLQYVKRLRNKETESQNAVIALGRSLALALEFKMGAEIVNTVIVRELKELLILGIVIVLRALLAVLIHWEITTEEKEEKAHAMARAHALGLNSDSDGDKEKTEEKE
jgi:uncharacterized membrane protein